MAIHKAKVIGQCAINDVAPGGTVDLDDEVTLVWALVEAGHVELIPEPEPEPEPKRGKKATASEKGSELVDLPKGARITKGDD